MREIKIGRLLPIIGSDQIVMVTDIEVLDNGDRELTLSNDLYARITAYEWAEMATKEEEQPISNPIPVDCQCELAQSRTT